MLSGCFYIFFFSFIFSGEWKRQLHQDNSGNRTGDAAACANSAAKAFKWCHRIFDQANLFHGCKELLLLCMLGSWNNQWPPYQSTVRESILIVVYKIRPQSNASFSHCICTQFNPEREVKASHCACSLFLCGIWCVTQSQRGRNNESEEGKIRVVPFHDNTLNTVLGFHSKKHFKLKREQSLASTIITPDVIYPTLFQDLL